MFDLTPHITLPTKSMRIYRSTQILIYTLFVYAGCVLLFKILFPAAYFTFDFTKPNALANTIATPYERGNTLLFDTAATGAFDSARITLTFRADTVPTSKMIATAQRGYVAQFYPLSTSDTYQITSTLKDYPLPSGILFERAGGIWIVTDDTHIAAIADAATFLAKGWSFDNVRTVASDDIANYQKRKLFTMKDAHPDGTIFHTLPSDHYERIRDGKRFSLTTENVQHYKSNHSIVSVTDASHTTDTFCTLTPHILPWKTATMTCTLSLTTLRDLIGTDYHFALPDVDMSALTHVAVTLRRASTTDNARASLALLKQRFLNHYTDK